MASKALKSPLVRHVTTRGYAQAAAAVVCPEGKFEACNLANKTFVAALDNGSPLARVTVAFKAGSRYEPAGESGLAHALRSAAGLSTGKSSGYLIQRKLSQIGAAVSASGDREFIYYTLEATQGSLMTAIEYLNNTVSCQEFRAWELADNVPRMKYDIVSLSPQVRAVDLLHKAAYRRGLGNSLFISPKQLGKLSSESLQHFAASTLTFDRCAVAIVGGDMAKASMVAQALTLTEGSRAAAVPSQYKSAELRKEMGGDLAHVALAVQGAPAGSPQALALAVVARALGAGPSVKWGADNTVLAKAIGNIGPFAAAGFSVSYSDSGLLGVVLTVPKDEANAAVKAVSKVLKAPLQCGLDLEAAKKQLKLQVLCEADDGYALSESMAAQGLYGGSAMAPSQIACAIEMLTPDSITKALTMKGGISMGAVGNLVNVPYVDEL